MCEMMIQGEFAMGWPRCLIRQSLGEIIPRWGGDSRDGRVRIGVKGEMNNTYQAVGMLLD